jgi:diguanylate cyclase (GGDEF)-like protein
LFLQLDQASIKDLLAKTDSKAIRGQNGVVSLSLENNKFNDIQIVAAHLCDSGLGVAFRNHDQALLKYLVNSTRQRKQGTAPRKTPGNSWKPGDQAAAAQMLQALQQLTEEYVSRRFGDFIRTAADDLLHAADSARSNKDQTDLLFASSRLGKDHAGLLKLLIQEINTKFSGMTNPREGHKTGEDELDLVDQEEFDEWIVIIGIARKFDDKLLATISRFERILNDITERDLGNEESPFSPYSLLWSFKEALEPLGFAKVAKVELYKAYQAAILAHLPELLEQINQTFLNKGIQESASYKPVSRPRTNSHALPQTDIDQAADEIARVHQKEDIIGALSSLSPHSTVSPLNQLRRNFRPKAGTHRGITANEEQVLQLLESMPAQQYQSIAERIKELIASESGGSADDIVFDDATRNSIETTESLVSSIEQDEFVGRELRSFIADLEIPLIKESLAHPMLLNDPDHPGRKLLQLAGDLAPFISSGQNDASNQPLLESLNQIKNLMKKKGHTDLPVIEKRMETLLKLQKQQFDENISLVLRSAQLEETRQRAQTFVLQFLENELTPDPVPSVIENLLQLGWAGLLAKTATTKSKQSKAWKGYSGVFNQLKSAFVAGTKTTPLPPAEVEHLTDNLSSGFQEYPVFSDKSNTFIAQLSEALTAESDSYPALADSQVVFSRETLIPFLPDYDPESETTEQIVAPPDLAPWIDQAKNIKIGDWIVEHIRQDQTKLLNLGWKSTNSHRFVFVDGGGHKALDIPLVEFAQALKERRYSLLENGQLPLVDRAVHRLLQQTFDQFRSESDKDELTGLLSRKAFQRLLSDALAKTRREEQQHVFITVDIDQFKMVNDICGIEGGDGLLIAVAGLLNTYSPRDAQLARVGDDEFGILINNCPIQRGYEIAERQRLAIESFKYNWDDTALSITSSVGVVRVDNTITSITDLINASVAACNLARQEGRNCTRIYQPTAEEYTSRQKLIKSVPVIEKAIEKDHLKLFGQLITPIAKDSQEKDHYEILLRVYDEDDNLTNPVQFIQAAEQFDRMRIVDRWVINSVFAWMNKHHAQLPNNECFSVNVSAQTFTDQGFSEFIHKKFSEVAFPAERIAFEITETAFVSNMERVKSIINEIKTHGCQFYLDDFGSGYSSYSYLKEFPVDVVKIDGIFVKDMLTEKSSYAMVKSITEVAHFMDKKVVAEFVSSVEILNALQHIGVDFAQGYAVGKPCDINELIIGNSPSMQAAR